LSVPPSNSFRFSPRPIEVTECPLFVLDLIDGCVGCVGCVGERKDAKGGGVGEDGNKKTGGGGG